MRRRSSFDRLKVSFLTDLSHDVGQSVYAVTGPRLRRRGERLILTTPRLDRREAMADLERFRSIYRNVLQKVGR